MFSGHTVMVVLLTLAWADYGFPRKYPPRRRSVLLGLLYTWSFFGLAALLAARYHYTIDIVIAAYAAHRTWRIYGALRCWLGSIERSCLLLWACTGYIADSPTLLQDSPLIKLLERRSSEGAMDEWAEQLGQARERVLAEMRGVQTSLMRSLRSGDAETDGTDTDAEEEIAVVARGRRATGAKGRRRGQRQERESDSDDDGDMLSLRRIGEWLLS